VFSEYPGTKVRSLLGNPPRAIHQHHGDQPPLIKVIPATSTFGGQRIRGSCCCCTTRNPGL